MCSFDGCWRVAFFEAGGVFDEDWPWDCALSADAPVLGKRGISSSEGKLRAGFAGGRRLLIRGTSASAKRKIVSDKASQFDICAAAPRWPGPTYPILRSHEAAEQ